MGRLGDLTEAQTPVLRDLESSADELDTLPHATAAFTAEGLPAFKALGEASVVGRRAVLKTTEEVNELRLLAKDAPGFAKPLRQLLQTIDDRGRAVTPDKRAAASGPPAGDQTHTTSSRSGFTGMEAIWNFFYWQTLSTNALEQRGARAAADRAREPVLALRGQADQGADRHLQRVPRPDTAGRDDAGSDRLGSRGGQDLVRDGARSGCAAERTGAAAERTGAAAQRARAAAERAGAAAERACADAGRSPSDPSIPALDFLLGP